jgi:hypothetical protein
MQLGTIGAGAVALAFAREALTHGHEVGLSSLIGNKGTGMQTWRLPIHPGEHSRAEPTRRSRAGGRGHQRPAVRYFANSAQAARED